MARLSKQKIKISDKKRLEIFLSNVEELKERPYIENGFDKFHFNISIDNNKRISFVSEEGDTEYLRSFLLSFRKFIMPNEFCFVERIINISQQFVKENEHELKEVLNIIKKEWKYRYAKGLIKIKQGDEQFTPKRVLDLWFNGKYFHTTDIDKSEKLKELMEKEIPNVRIQLMWSLPLLTDVVIRLGYVIEKALKNEAFDFPSFTSTGAHLMTLDLPSLEAWLWGSADILRGSIDSSDYKNYIFGLLFLKRANDVFEEETENLVHKENWDRESAEADPDYHRFFLPENARWQYITEKTENIGEAIDEALAAIEEHNPSLEGVMTAVHFGNKEILSDNVLQRLLHHFNKYSLKNKDLYTPDLLGDAYEYLIKMFADDAGKKGGEFYTPKGVVRLIVGLIKPQPKNSVYDPTGGSGGLIVESARYIAEQGGKIGNLLDASLYAQEKNLNTWAICKINMIFHNYPDADIKKGCTLASPKHITQDGELMTFDRVVANPPFSQNKWWDPIEVDIKVNEKGKELAPNYAKSVSDPYGRFTYGIPPRGYADLAFLQHMISVLKHDGKLGVVLPHGVLFRGGAEGKIRKGILKEDILEAVVGLPSKLFYNTGIPASILVVNKSKPAHLKNKVIFIDASKDYKEGKNRNRLEDEHVKKIVAAYDGGQDIDKFMRIVDMTEIKENDYNLNIARYIDTSEEEEAVDIVATLESIKAIEAQEKGIDEKLVGYLKELGL